MGLTGLLRTLLIAVAVWWLYKVIRRWLDKDDHAKRTRVRSAPDTSSGKIEVMVQDPQCGTYLPESEAIRTKISGEYVHFCSEKCRQGYYDALEGKNK